MEWKFNMVLNKLKMKNCSNLTFNNSMIILLLSITFFIFMKEHIFIFVMALAVGIVSALNDLTLTGSAMLALFLFFTYEKVLTNKLTKNEVSNEKN